MNHKVCVAILAACLLGACAETTNPVGPITNPGDSIPIDTVPTAKACTAVLTYVDYSDWNSYSGDVKMSCEADLSKEVALTSDNLPKTEPVLAADLSKLFYVKRSHDGCRSFLTRANGDGTNPVEVTGKETNGVCALWGITSPRINPSSNRLAFLASAGTDFTFYAYTAKGDGSDAQKLVTNVQGFIAWMGDCEVITGKDHTLSTTPYVNRKEYFRRNVCTGEEKMIYLDANDQSGQALRFLVWDVSPDKEWVAITTAFNVAPANRVGILRTNGSGEIRWLADNVQVSEPYFCYDNSLCFVGIPNRQVVWGVNLDGTGLRTVKQMGNGHQIGYPRRVVLTTPRVF